MTPVDFRWRATAETAYFVAKIARRPQDTEHRASVYARLS